MAASDPSVPSSSRTKKKERRAIPPQLRLKVWETYIGKSLEGVCFVCERTQIIFGTNVEYGHVTAVANGGADTIENLRPICGPCNKSMGTENLFEYKRRLIQSGVIQAAHIETSTVGEVLRDTFDDAQVLVNYRKLNALF